jgi:protein NrfD
VALSSILFLFLTHLGIGIVFTLLLVSREVGVRFFRFNAGLALILMVAGLTFRPAGLELAWDAAGLALGALMVSMGALFVFWVVVGRALATVRPLLLHLSATAGMAALIGQALAVPMQPGWLWQVFGVASFLSSAALLGGACTAMILGHWYLVLPSMQVSHLQEMVKFHFGSIAARLVVVGGAVLLAILSWQPGVDIHFEGYILSVEGIFFWQRVLFGLLGPIVLSYLTWETAKISSTQSATGILYVDFFTVIVGEILAKYLLMATGVPL